MKIAVTSKGTDLDAQVDPRFGRAQYIMIVDPETLDFEALDNTIIMNKNPFFHIYPCKRLRPECFFKYSS